MLLGQTYEQIIPEDLMETRVQVIHDQQCNETLTSHNDNWFRSDVMICTGSDDDAQEEVTSICDGDSGGPLLCIDLGGRWTIEGVSSFSLSSQARHAGQIVYCDGVSGYTQVDAFLQWIKPVLDENQSQNLK